ncbi:MAG TPA: TIM barrel protein [Baekduia sp.]|uniref:TIM barrel protein n=1 Tax=Baekduia sp. TaxID=2600305 RepID=UPI002B64A774|nr:TIM barrel protein [Baekduia sp.]HMJ36529.1 TIM barrel protein [Baekduia sp.]
MIPALAPASPQVAGHHTVGASTGYMTADHGDWPALLERAVATSTLAVELSALSEPELPDLVELLQDNTVLPFLFVSVHAPTKGRRLSEPDLVTILSRLAARVDAIVVHPDTIENPRAYRPLGSALVLENMDARKATGRTAAELADLFAALPAAGLCFDVPHAASVDPTLGVAREILDRHGARLRHVHLSSLDAGCHHRPLTAADEERFAELLDRCRDVPWILEAPLADR